MLTSHGNETNKNDDDDAGATEEEVATKWCC